MNETTPGAPFGDDILEAGLDAGLAAGFSPPAEMQKAPDSQAEPERNDRQGQIWFGDYRVIREVGRGGMGVVYEAEQASLGRRVALKVLPYHGLRSSGYVERFRREAQAAAGLHHTNIVTVYGVGEHRGIPYYAMRFIEGRSLDKVIRELAERRADSTPTAPMADGAMPLPYAAHELYRFAVRLGVQAAGALAHAHERGVLHRDIKPSNLLLDAQGDVWITDFGLAKAEGAESLTQSGDLLGTIKYMAPERFEGLSLPQGDVYSLGLTLYELLTLQPAFEGSSREGLIDKVLKEVPPAPCRLDRGIPRDLETIVLKASAKAPQERYANAADMADDLRRFLEDRPIAARRASVAERAWRWCRRNPVVAGLGSGVILLLAALAVSYAVYAGRLKLERDQVKAEQGKTAESLGRAEKAERERTQDLYRSYVAQAGFGRLTGRAGQAFGGLDAIRKAIRLIGAENLSDAEVEELRDEAIACLATPDISVPREKEPEMDVEVGGVAIDSKMERYTHGDSKGFIHLRDWQTGQLLAKFHPTRQATFWYTQASFSPDDRFLLIRYLCLSWPHLAVLWDLEAGEPVLSVDTYGEAALGDDGSVFVAAVEGGSVAGFDCKDGRERFRIGKDLIEPRLRLDRSGRRLAAAAGKRLLVYDVLSGEEAAAFDAGMLIHALAWSGDARWLAAGGADDHIHVYDAEGRALRSRLAGHEAHVIGLEFLPGDRLLASASWDATTRLWDPLGGKEWVRVEGNFVGWSPDAHRLGLLKSTAVAVCDVAHGEACRWLQPRTASPPFHWSTSPGPYELDWSPDGRWIASAHSDGVRLWDAWAGGEEAAHLPLGFVDSVRLDPRGGWLVTYGELGLWRWPLAANEGGAQMVRVGPPEPLRLEVKTGTQKLSFDASGGSLAYTDQVSTRIAVRDLSDAEVEVSLPSSERAILAVLSPDGSRVAGMKWKDFSMSVWCVATGGLEATLAATEKGGHGVYAQSAAFSPDGRWLAVGSNQSFRAWKVGTWELAGEIPRAFAEVGMAPLAVSREGDLLALAVDPRTVTLVETSTWRRSAVLTSPDPRVITSLSFSPDSTRLAAATQERSIQLWDLGALRHEIASLGIERGFPAFRKAPAAPAPLRVDVMGAEVPRDIAAKKRSEEILRRLRELAPRWIERSDDTRSETQRELEAILGFLAVGHFQGCLEGSQLAGLSEETRASWDLVRLLAGGMRAAIADDLPPPGTPRNVLPADGEKIEAGPALLETTPFSSSDARAQHGWSRLEVREAGGRYDTNPVYDVLLAGAAVRWTLPAGLLLSGKTYFWRAAHVGLDGRSSEFSAETSVPTGELGLEPVPFDLSKVFNRDVVANPGDAEEDEFDPGNGDRPQLTVNGFNGTSADNHGVRGLPHDRLLGVHRLGDYALPNVLQLSPAHRDPVRLTAPPGRYAAVRFLLSGGWGDSAVPIAFVYASGARVERRLACDNGKDELPPTRENVLAEGSIPAWSGMDIIRSGRLLKDSDWSLFEVILPAERADEIREIVLEPAKGAFERPVTRFNLFAVTGMKVR